MINVVRKGQRERETREGERRIHRHTEMEMESQKERNDLQEKSQRKTYRCAETVMERDQRKSQKETHI